MLRCLPGHVYEKRVVCPEWAEHCLALINNNDDREDGDGGDNDNYCDDHVYVLPDLDHHCTTLLYSLTAITFLF